MNNQGIIWVRITQSKKTMLLQKEISLENVSIKAYQPGKITLNIGSFDKPVLLVNGEKIEFTGAIEFNQLSLQDIQNHINCAPEILIIGSGGNHKILPLEITKGINEMGIAVESMASRQACHTYQVLIHDKRSVCALIYP